MSEENSREDPLEGVLANESAEARAARIADEALAQGVAPATDAPAEDGPSMDQMRQLGQLVIGMSRLQLEEIELRLKLEAVQSDLKIYETKLVPNCMSDIGVDSISMKGSGATVRLETAIHYGLSKDQAKRRQAMEYLKKSGNDELITRDVTISFDRSSTAEAERLMAVLDEEGFGRTAEIGYEWTVNHMTLGKFVRDTMAAEKLVLQEGGEPELPIPREPFGIFEQKKAVIERKKR